VACGAIVHRKRGLSLDGASLRAFRTIEEEAAIVGHFAAAWLGYPTARSMRDTIDALPEERRLFALLVDGRDLAMAREVRSR
jgi:hypothetical protein